LQDVSVEINSFLWEADNLVTDALQLGTTGGFNLITFSPFAFSRSWAHRLGYSYSVFALQVDQINYGSKVTAGSKPIAAFADDASEQRCVPHLPGFLPMAGPT
jgi:hypothetical protein